MFNLLKSNKKEITLQDFKKAKKTKEGLYKYKDRYFLAYKLEESTNNFYFENMNKYIRREILSIGLIPQGMFIFIAETKEKDYYLLLNITKNFFKYIDLKFNLNKILGKYGFYYIDTVDYKIEANYSNLENFNFDLLEEKTTAEYYKQNNSKEGLSLKNNFIKDFKFDEFNTDTNPNVFILTSSNSDRVTFLNKLHESQLKQNKKLFLVTHNYEFESLIEKNKVTPITIDNLEINLFKLYEKDNEHLNEHIIKGLSYILLSLINYDSEDTRKMLYMPYIEKSISEILNKYGKEGTLEKVVNILNKEIFIEEDLESLKDFIKEDSDYFNIFNKGFNLEIKDNLNVIYLSRKDKYTDSLKLGYFISILLKKEKEKNYEKFIFGLTEFLINKNRSYIYGMAFLLRISRKFNISIINPVDQIYNDKKIEDLIKDKILHNHEHIFILPTRYKTDYFNFKEDLYKRLYKMNGSKELIYIKKGRPLFLKYKD